MSGPILAFSDPMVFVTPEERVFASISNKIAEKRTLTLVEQAITDSPGFIRYVEKTVRFWDAQEKQLEAKKRDLLRERAKQERLRALITKFEAFLTCEVRLEKPEGSLWTRALNAVRNGAAYGSDAATFLALKPDDVVPFVVEHDWHAAIKGAENFSDGEIRHPYESIAFEFRISGTPVIWIEKLGRKFIMFRLGGEWLLSDLDDPKEYEQGRSDLEKDYNNLGYVLHDQMRAICIALDAQVAVSEVIREPSNGSDMPASAQHPLRSYHVVRLAHRARLPAPDHTQSTHARHRMHFVRGHWRRYQQHKTWIKWHLRGDPDLGFIDKHYRL